MQVSCLQENLARGLSMVGRAVVPRSSWPILGNILIATDDGRLRLAATDREIGITCWIGAKVEDEGTITVPARLLSDFVNQLPPELIDMNLSVRTLTLNLKCARFDTNVKGIDASEFPILLTASDDSGEGIGNQGFHITSIPVSTMGQMINQVAFAAAKDESRPSLTGVNARFDGERLTMAATDGFRLAIRSTILENPPAEPIEMVIPARALTELQRVIGLLPASEDEQMVDIYLADTHNQVLFHLPDVDMVSSLIELSFPKYEAIIPKTFATRTVVDTGSLLKALRVANIFARDSLHIVRFQVAPGVNGQPGTLTLTATSAESGDNVAELDALVEGGESEIAFNARYMIEVLNAIEEPEIALETTRASAPGVIRPVGVGPEEFTCVVMPMHISG
ncbi:MAG: DNA polymerase III subunit beta [Chloroflexota bacterium]|nr:DNA polymerase III subunit beta [Chloroflexota bacterium]